MALLVLLTADLTVISRVEGAAARAGAKVRVVSSESQAVECCAAESAECIIIDLSLPSLDLKALVAQLTSATPTAPRAIAFGPHVHEERLAAARDAGCNEVVSRGQFFAQLDTLLRH